jgi:predicted kinase
MLLVLVGYPGSGKSTFSQHLIHKVQSFALDRNVSQQIIRVSQDDLGNRKRCEQLTKKSLDTKSIVIIDRTNSTIEQRLIWLQIANQYQVPSIAVVFQVDKATCIERAKARLNHPTVPPEKAAMVVNFTKMEPVTKEEGFYDTVMGPDAAELSDRVFKVVQQRVEESLLEKSGDVKVVEDQLSDLKLGGN